MCLFPLLLAITLSCRCSSLGLYQVVEVSLLEGIVDDPFKYGTVVSGEDSADHEKCDDPRRRHAESGAASRRAAKQARRIALQTNTPLVVWDNGRVVKKKLTGGTHQ